MQTDSILCATGGLARTSTYGAIFSPERDNGRDVEAGDGTVNKERLATYCRQLQLCHGHCGRGYGMSVLILDVDVQDGWGSKRVFSHLIGRQSGWGLWYGGVFRLYHLCFCYRDVVVYK